MKNEEMTSSDDSNYGGVFEGQLPIIGYIKSCQPNDLILYSLKIESAIHIQKFGSAIMKFETSLPNVSNKLIVLLREGVLKIISLKTMSAEVNIPTHYILPQLLSLKKSYDLSFITSNLPKYSSMSSNLYCYVHNSLNQEDELREYEKTLKDSILGKNVYTKEAATKFNEVYQKTKQLV